MEKGKFRLGQIVMTRRINDRVADDERFARFVTDSLKRHANGDWGDLHEADRQENELSLKEGLRLFSVYHYKEGKIWIITEADRSTTTISFPEEY
jgi:hypothetical protein